MDSNKMEYNKIVKDHYEYNWGCKYQLKKWNLGPMHNLSNDFVVLEYEPSDERKMWTYATSGMSSMDYDNPIELHIFSSKQDFKIIELLTAVSYYHRTENKLDVNHTVNFGEPWQQNSKCTYGLISLPYLDGPRLEILKMDDIKEVHFYWLIPITIEELEYKKLKGIDALEEKFDESHFDYLNPIRQSVI